MNPETSNETVKEKKVLSPERRAQLAKALEKANEARRKNVDIKKKEKELQKKVYVETVKDIERRNALAEQKLAKMSKKKDPAKPTYQGEQLTAPESSSDDEEPESSRVPVKKIKITRKKRVMVEYSDSDDDVNEDKIKQAFKMMKGKGIAGPSRPELTPEEYQETLLRARYGSAVKQIVQKNVEDEEKTLKYYHGLSGDKW